MQETSTILDLIKPVLVRNMAVRATSSWKVVAGNLVTLPEVVSAEEEWEGEADDAEKCVRLEGEGRGELVLEAVPGKVISDSHFLFIKFHFR